MARKIKIKDDFSKTKYPDIDICGHALDIFDLCYDELEDFRKSTQAEYLGFRGIIHKMENERFDHTKLNVDDKKIAFSLAKKLLDTGFERYTFYEYKNNIWFMIEIDPDYEILQDEITDMGYSNEDIYYNEIAEELNISDSSFDLVYDRLSLNKFQIDPLNTLLIPEAYVIQYAYNNYQHLMGKRYTKMPKYITKNKPETKEQIYSMIKYWTNKKGINVEFYELDENYVLSGGYLDEGEYAFVV